MDLSSLESACELTLFLGLSILCILVTVVFCFWCIYLLDGMKRKWKLHRNAYDSLEMDENNQEEIMAYNAETEFTKYVFLFFINLAEWVTLMTTALTFTPNLILRYDVIVSKGEHLANLSHGSDLDEQKGMKRFISSLTFGNWSINCSILSLVLVASLCSYLAARQARLSWIKSNEIPYLIVFFLISLIVTQTISTIYSTIYFLISNLCYSLLFITALIIMTKQYRKLLMVINWSIVDLQISGNIHLLKKQIRMKCRFKRIFKFLFASYIIAIPNFILITMLDIISVCSEQTALINSKIVELFHPTAYVLYLVQCVIVLTAMMFLSIPYTGFGISTICVIIWRLINGKTGYKTHFKYPQNIP